VQLSIRLHLEQFEDEIEGGTDLLGVGGIEAADVKQALLGVAKKHHASRPAARSRLEATPSVGKEDSPQPRTLLPLRSHVRDDRRAVVRGLGFLPAVDAPCMQSE
jgi:hypothetical protein